MSSARNIPGFYFDAEKGKYFKIQKNHLAPAGTAYTKDAVNAKLASQATEKYALVKQSRTQRGCIRKPHISAYSNLRLATELGFAPKQNVQHLRRTFANSLLTRRLIVQSGLRSITATKDGKLYLIAQDAEERSVLYEYLYDSTRIVRHNFTRPIMPDVRTKTAIQGEYHATLYGNSLEYGTMGGNALTSWDFDSTIWDIALSSTSTPKLAIATEEGLFVSVDGQHSRLSGVIEKEQMCASMKDTNIVMSGERGGTVHFTDLRNRGTVSRLRHPSGVSGLTATRRSEQILVNGLQHAAIYDLRYTKASTNGTRYMRSEKKQGRGKSQSSATTPYVSFHLSKENCSNFYESGNTLAYLADQDIAVIATKTQQSSRMGSRQDVVLLFDVRTGKMLRSLARSWDPESHIIGIASSRFRDGPESIIVAEAPDLMMEWAVDLGEVAGHPKKVGPAFNKDSHVLQYWQA